MAKAAKIVSEVLETVVETGAEATQAAVTAVENVASASSDAVENVVESITAEPKNSMKWVFIAGGVLAVVAALWLLKKPAAEKQERR